MLYLSIFVLLGGVLAYLRWHAVIQSIVSVSQELLNTEKQRFEASRATTGDLIRALSYDYTLWDEMVDAISRENQVWFRENITPALETYKVDAAWVFTSDYEQIYRVDRGGRGLEFPLQDFAQEQAQLFRDGNFVNFYSVIQGDLYQILGAPAQPTIDVGRVTSPQGYFFVARKLDRPDILNRLESLGDVDVKISTKTSIQDSLIVPRQGTFMFEDPIYGYNGEQVGVYNVSGYSSYMERTANLLYGQYLVFIVVILSFLMVIGVTIYLVITHPLRRLSKGIANRDPKALAYLRRRHDELGQVADLIVQEQDQELALQATQKELELAQLKLEKQLRESERMNDLMVGRELRMIELKNQLSELRKGKPKKKGESR